MSDAPQPSSTPPPPPPPPPPPGSIAPPPPVAYGYAPVPAESFAGLPLTSRGKRFGGWLLDGLLVVVTLVIGWLIWSIIIWERGQSPAKSILGMRVMHLETGRPAGRGQMALRELVGKVLLGFVPLYTLVSAVLVLSDTRRQGLWDKIANTVVVDDPDNLFKV